MNKAQFVFGKREQQQAIRQQELNFVSLGSMRQAVQQLETDSALLETANTAQTKQIIQRLLQRQQRMINVLRHLVAEA